MSILRAALGADREARGSTLIQNPGVPLTSTILLSLFAGAQTDSGMQITPQSALGISAVYRCVSILAGTVASLELNAYQSGTNQLVGLEAESEGTGHAPSILENPHPLYTRHEFIELAMFHELFWGNFYGLKVRDNKTAGLPVVSVMPILPWTIVPHWVVPEGKRVPTEKLFVWTLGDGTTVGLTSDDILHIPAMGYNGLVGLAPLELFRQTYGIALATEKTGAKFFGSGNLMSGFLHTDKKLTEQQARGLKERWQERMAGVTHAGEVMVLDSGATFQALSIPPEQAQFLQTREFEVLEVCRIFGVPPHLLAASTASTWGTGIEQLNMGLSQFSITPWTSRFEARFTKELLPADQFAKFNTGLLTKGDTRTRYSAHILARRGHWESINEIRAGEGLAPIDDPRADDVFYGAGETGGGVGGDIGTDPTLPGGNDGNEAGLGDGTGTGDGTSAI